MTYPPVPLVVRQMMRQLAAHTDVEPQAEMRRTPPRWRITHTNGSLVLVYDYKLAAGRWVYAGSTLTVDGAQRRLVKSLPHYAAVFRATAAGQPSA